MQIVGVEILTFNTIEFKVDPCAAESKSTYRDQLVCLAHKHGKESLNFSQSEKRIQLFSLNCVGIPIRGNQPISQAWK